MYSTVQHSTHVLLCTCMQGLWLKARAALRASALRASALRARAPTSHVRTRVCDAYCHSSTILLPLQSSSSIEFNTRFATSRWIGWNVKLPTTRIAKPRRVTRGFVEVAFAVGVLQTPLLGAAAARAFVLAERLYGASLLRWHRGLSLPLAAHGFKINLRSCSGRHGRNLGSLCH